MTVLAFRSAFGLDAPAPVVYTFDEGTDGVAVPTGGNISVNDGVTYSALAAVHGSLGIRSTGQSDGLKIDTPAGFIGTSATHSGSMYATPRTVTGASVRIVTGRTSALAIIWAIRFHSDTTIDLAGTGNTRVTTSTLTWTANTKYRIDWQYTGGGSASVTYRIFAGANVEGTVPDETVTGAVATTAQTNWLISPSAVAAAGAGSLIDLDTVRFYDGLAWAGPYGAPGSTVSPGVAVSTPATFSPTATTPLTVTPDVAVSAPSAYNPTVTLGSVTTYPPEVVAGFSEVASGTPTAVSASLPTGIHDNDVGFAVLSVNSASEVPTAGPSGWTLIDGPLTNAAGNLRSWLYQRTMAAADSGGAFTATLSAGFRWTVGGAILRGTDGATAVVSASDNTDDLALSIPSVTPTADNSILLALAGVRYATGTTGVTPTGGWTELADLATVNTAPKFGTWVGVETSAHSSGVATTAADMTFAGSARGNVWTLSLYSLVPPATTVTPDVATSAPAALAPAATTLLTIVPDLAVSAPSAFAPVATSTITVVPGLATSAPSALAPSVTTPLTVVPDLAVSTPSAFAPAATGTITVTPGIATSTPAALAPAATTPVTVTPGIATSAPVALAPAATTTLTVTPGLAVSAPVALAPDAVYGAVTVTPGLAVSTPAAQAPAVTTPVTVVPDPAVSTPQALDPAVVTSVTIVPGIASSSPTALSPAVTTSVTVGPGLATSNPAAYAPSASYGGVTVTPGVAVSTPAAYDPVIMVQGGPTVAVPNLAVATPAALAPAVTATLVVTPDLAVSVSVAYGPTVTLNALVVSPGLATSAPAAYAPVITLGTVAGPITVSPGLAVSTPAAYAPVVTLVGVTTGVLSTVAGTLTSRVTRGSLAQRRLGAELSSRALAATLEEV